MGFLDKFEEAAKNFDYERAANSIRNEVERKQASVEKNLRRKVRNEVRNYTDETLRYKLKKTNNEIFADEIRKEMRRRGMY